MPGDFIEEVHIYKCGERPDGTAIMCSEIGYAKIPFGKLEVEDSASVGWQEPGYPDVHIVLSRLVGAMKQFGITMTYDEDELARRLGPPPGSAGQ